MDITIEDMRKRARRNVPKVFFDYLDSGSWSQQTFRANEIELQKLHFKQRVLVDMSDRSLKTTMIGEEVSMPVALAPVGFTGMQHARGEILAAQAAEEFGIPFTLSTMSVCSIEDVAKATKKPFWFQLYYMKDPDFMEDLLSRAEKAKCSALVITADLQMEGDRYANYRDGLAGDKWGPKLGSAFNIACHPVWGVRMLRGKKITLGNIIGHAKGANGFKDMLNMASWVDDRFDEKLSYKELGEIRKRWNGKIIIKGIMCVEDAKKAADFGADAIIVSNHGGRQFDGTPATIEVLPHIIDAVGDRIEVFMDSGIRSGQDVLRAVAYGARGTLIGRAYNYGLGAHGKEGVTAVLQLIRNQLDKSMAFAGERDILDVGRHILWNPEIFDHAIIERPDEEPGEAQAGDKSVKSAVNGSSAKKATSTKTSAKKASAKKASVNKAPAKKVPAKKTPERGKSAKAKEPAE